MESDILPNLDTTQESHSTNDMEVCVMNLDEIKNEVIEEEIKDKVEVLNVTLDDIISEVLDDAKLCNKDLPLQSEVEPFVIGLDEIKKEELDEDGVRVKYPIDEPGCSSWISPVGLVDNQNIKSEPPDPDIKQELSSTSSTSSEDESNLRLLGHQKMKSESPDPDIKEEDSSSEDESNLSLQDEKSLMDEAVISSLKSEEVDLEMKTEGDPTQDPDGVWKASQFQPKIVDIAFDIKKKNQFLPEQLSEEGRIKMYHCNNCEKKTQTYPCTFCKYKSKSSLKPRIKIYSCILCEYKTKKNYDLKRHIIAKHKSFDEVKVYSCILCEYKTKINAYLKHHILSKHCLLRTRKTT